MAIHLVRLQLKILIVKTTSNYCFLRTGLGTHEGNENCQRHGGKVTIVRR